MLMMKAKMYSLGSTDYKGEEFRKTDSKTNNDVPDLDCLPVNNKFIIMTLLLILFYATLILITK